MLGAVTRGRHRARGGPSPGLVTAEGGGVTKGRHRVGGAAVWGGGPAGGGEGGSAGLAGERRQAGGGSRGPRGQGARPWPTLEGLLPHPLSDFVSARGQGVRTHISEMRLKPRSEPSLGPPLPSLGGSRAPSRAAEGCCSLPAQNHRTAKVLWSKSFA